VSQRCALIGRILHPTRAAARGRTARRDTLSFQDGGLRAKAYEVPARPGMDRRVE
jgi:hypothetical protein